MFCIICMWCFPLNMTCPMNPKACPMNPDGCPIHPFNTLRSLKAYYSIYMSLNTLDLPPFDHVLNTLECVVHCGHLMRRQPVISEFKVAISKKWLMNPGFTLGVRYRTPRLRGSGSGTRLPDTPLRNGSGSGSMYSGGCYLK